jgi:hypothetical protein
MRLVCRATHDRMLCADNRKKSFRRDEVGGRIAW